MSKRCMLSTIDNPFNPFEDFISWYMYDMDKDYNCSGLIARLAMTSDEMSTAEENQEIERIIDSIIKYNPRKIYKKVTDGIE